jgi:hypothetical protein
LNNQKLPKIIERKKMKKLVIFIFMILNSKSIFTAPFEKCLNLCESNFQHCRQNIREYTYEGIDCERLKLSCQRNCVLTAGMLTTDRLD